MPLVPAEIRGGPPGPFLVKAVSHHINTGVGIISAGLRDQPEKILISLLGILGKFCAFSVFDPGCGRSSLIIHHQPGKRYFILFKKEPSDLSCPIIFSMVHHIIIKTLVIILYPDLVSGKSHLLSRLIHCLDKGRRKFWHSYHHSLDLPHRLSDTQKGNTAPKIDFH